MPGLPGPGLCGAENGSVRGEGKVLRSVCLQGRGAVSGNQSGIAGERGGLRESGICPLSQRALRWELQLVCPEQGEEST